MRWNDLKSEREKKEKRQQRTKTTNAQNSKEFFLCFFLCSCNLFCLLSLRLCRFVIIIVIILVVRKLSVGDLRTKLQLVQNVIFIAYATKYDGKVHSNIWFNGLGGNKQKELATKRGKGNGERLKEEAGKRDSHIDTLLGQVIFAFVGEMNSDESDAKIFLAKTHNSQKRIIVETMFWETKRLHSIRSIRPLSWLLCSLCLFLSLSLTLSALVFILLHHTWICKLTRMHWISDLIANN